MKTSRIGPRAGMAGFTLLESVIVIVVTGILAAIVAIFIRAPVQGYFDSVRRAELTDQADVALRRITRDVRLALPNSLRITQSGGVNYIEFLMTSTGGRYRNTDDGSIGGDFLSFTNVGDVSFDVHGPAPAIFAGDTIVIYNLGPGNAPADAYAGGNRATVANIAGNTITLNTNPYAAQSPPLASPNGRFQVIPSGATNPERQTGPVSYSCPVVAAGDLTRFWNYPIAINQPTAAVGTSALLAASATCAISYAPASGGRNGLLEIALTLTSGGETITLAQQIRVDNSP